jgi:hypothetical protein
MDMGDLIDYIRNQWEHHRKKSFEEEFRNLIIEDPRSKQRGIFDPQ